MVAFSMAMAQGLLVLLLVLFLWRQGRQRESLSVRGWRGMQGGLLLVVAGMVVEHLPQAPLLTEHAASSHWGEVLPWVGGVVTLAGWGWLLLAFSHWLSGMTSLEEVDRFSRRMVRTFSNIASNFMQVKRAEERYQTISDATRDAIVAFDETGVISFWNSGAQSLFGYQGTEVLTHSMFQLFPEEKHKLYQNALKQMNRRAEEGVSGRALEVLGKGKNGQLLSLEMTLGTWVSQGVRQYCAVLRDISERKKAERDAERVQQSRVAMSTLLRIALEPITLCEQLAKALDVILSVPWLKILGKGGIFLLDEESGDLTLTVHRGLHPHLLEACARVPMGYCYCGRAAQSRELLYSGCIDHHHDISFDGIQPHGHYCVPILSQGRLLGIINTYLNHGHPRNEEEVEFLRSMANTLAGLIERKRAEELLRHVAFHDHLTGLPNRKLLMDQIAHALASARRRKRQLALLFLDLDRFKEVNDTHGHEVGDLLLAEAARRIRLCLRGEDFVARLGGDEFVGVLTEIMHQEDAGWVANRLIEQLNAPFLLHGKACQVGVSIGVSLFPRDGEEPDDLLKLADQAMYQVKKHGRNGCRFHGPETQPCMGELPVVGVSEHSESTAN